jgi:hypothetical protein
MIDLEQISEALKSQASIQNVCDLFDVSIGELETKLLENQTTLQEFERKCKSAGLAMLHIRRFELAMSKNPIMLNRLADDYIFIKDELKEGSQIQLNFVYD